MKNIAYRLVVFLLCFTSPVLSAYESELPAELRSKMPPPNLDVVSWVIMNPDTGKMIAAENPDQKLEPDEDKKYKYIWSAREKLNAIPEIVFSGDNDEQGNARLEEMAKGLGRGK